MIDEKGLIWQSGRKQILTFLPLLLIARIGLYLCILGSIFPSEVGAENPPVVLVVFGATGDLMGKKIGPAIDQLRVSGRLPDSFTLVGIGRKSEDVFRKGVSFHYPLTYHKMDFEESGRYADLASLLSEIDRKSGGPSRKIYYLATQPVYFSLIVEHLAQNGLIFPSDEEEAPRLLIEKPFGWNLSSALAIQESISRYAKEIQIYRIDHYLAKPGVHHLVDLRQNGDLESRWNREHIDRIDLLLSEEIGIDGRARLWEETGLFSDVIQNHMLQLVSLIAMDLGPSIPKEKIKVLQSIQPLSIWVRGQYGRGKIRGKEVAAYREEEGVFPRSNVETFVSAEIAIDNDRWKGVPFRIRSGKRLSSQIVEIEVAFKNREVLHIRIQPDPLIFFEQGISFSFPPPSFSEAYEQLLFDCIRGDRRAFVEKEEQFAAWKIVAPPLERKDPVVIYQAGSGGPSESPKGDLFEPNRDWVPFKTPILKPL